MPNQPAACACARLALADTLDGLTPGWHIWNALTLLFLSFGEVRDAKSAESDRQAPKATFWLNKMDGWAGVRSSASSRLTAQGIVGKKVGVWPTGAIQVLVALGMLRVSCGVMVRALGVPSSTRRATFASSGSAS